MSHISGEIFKDRTAAQGLNAFCWSHTPKPNQDCPPCEALPRPELHFPSCCSCTSDSCGNQGQTKCGRDRLGWRASLSDRVRCLKPFAILDRNNSLKSPQQGSVGAAKEITTRAPSPSHADSYSMIWATWIWWLRWWWWFYCLQSIKSGLAPHNLKCHHNVSESWALPKRTPCITETFFICFLYA